MPQLKQIIKRSKMAKNHGRDSGDVAYRNKQGNCNAQFLKATKMAQHYILKCCAIIL